MRKRLPPLIIIAAIIITAAAYPQIPNSDSLGHPRRSGQMVEPALGSLAHTADATGAVGYFPRAPAYRPAEGELCEVRQHIRVDRRVGTGVHAGTAGRRSGGSHGS